MKVIDVQIMHINYVRVRPTEKVAKVQTVGRFSLEPC